MRIRWSPAARDAVRGYMRDQEGVRAVAAAVEALAAVPYPPPPDGVHHGDYHRLHVGPYRILYGVDGDVITIDRVDKVL